MNSATITEDIEQCSVSSDSMAEASEPESTTSTSSMVTSATSADSSVGSLDLPRTSFDGQHLNWQDFRKEVLRTHHIAIVETAPKNLLPSSLFPLIEAASAHQDRFHKQRYEFRQQCQQGRGFGPSPIFPPNLLPTLEPNSNLTRCMVPAFGREALPERDDEAGPRYELAVPRPGLGCGFSRTAFTTEELRCLPSVLALTGTIVSYDTGYISPNAELYCPFLVFERTHGQVERRLETANNQCAIAGAWCTRAIQTMYTRAWTGETANQPQQRPISFSCVIDNDVAIVNFHYIDDTQTYCMAPLVKFDLSTDEHFLQFECWIEAIGQWATKILLPRIKRALDMLTKRGSVATPKKLKKLDLNFLKEGQILVTALKETFDDVPWRINGDGDEFTPVSSSIASWGSPLATDFPLLPKYSKQRYLSSGLVAPSPLRSVMDATPISGRGDEQATPIALTLPPTRYVRCAAVQSPPPAYLNSQTDDDTQKRLIQALGEILELKTQLQQLKTETTSNNISVHKELTTVKNNVANVLRKEHISQLSSNRFRSINDVMLKSSVEGDIRSTVVTTPTDPRASFWPRLRSPRGPSRLQALRPSDMPVSQSTSTELLSSQPSPALASAAISHAAFQSPTFSVFGENGEEYMVVPPPPPQHASLWKWCSALLLGHFAASWIPVTVLRVAVLGLMTDFCLLAYASPHWGSTAAYMTGMWKNE